MEVESTTTIRRPSGYYYCLLAPIAETVEGPTLHHLQFTHPQVEQAFFHFKLFQTLPLAKLSLRRLSEIIPAQLSLNLLDEIIVAHFLEFVPHIYP